MDSTGQDSAPLEARFEDVEEVFAFGDFQIFPSRRLLLEGGNRLAIGSRAFDILTALVRAAGSVVTKQELVTQAWPGVFVQDGSLRVQINGLRKLLRDGMDDRRFIVNDAGRGYSLAAPVAVRVESNSKIIGRPPCFLPDNLPNIVTQVFGRDASIQTLAVEMPKHRFITIVGPGGIGKTTLAVLAASTMRNAYGDGALFVDLAPINDPDLVPSVLASALGLAVKSEDPVPDLIGFLRDKHLLVVLDNCEHVIGAAATLVDVILSRTAQVQILATSREPLCARGERVHHLDPLETPAENQILGAEDAMRFSAVQLFVDRTDAALGGFKLCDADVSTVVGVCRRLDGMALAIELATARVGTLGVSGIAAGLENRFQLLSKGLRTAPQRHRTLYAVFDWSYQLLKPAEQRVFRRLSVLAGRFSIEAAIAIAADGETSANDVDENVATLVAATLLTAEVTGQTATYRLLDSARAYGREKLSELGEAD